MPTDLERQGDFSQTLSRTGGGFTIYDPATGAPLTMTHANGRPIRIRNPKLGGPVSERLDRYFDTSAFQPLPNQYTISPEPALLAELRAPTAAALNLSALKSFAIYERLRLQIRMDAIGLRTPRSSPRPEQTCRILRLSE